MKMFENSVIKAGARPKIRDAWGPNIVSFMRKAFADTPNRPSMSEVCEVLREEINSISDEEITDMLDASRKSQLSAG